MAEGTILAEIVLEGDRTFRKAVESSGDQMDDAAGDATIFSGTLGRVGSALETVRNRSLGAAGSLSLLAGRADEAGDELSQAGRRAAVTSGMFSALTASTDGLAISFGTLSTVATLSLIPALGVLSTMLVPLVGALGGFIAVAGSIGGIGMVGTLAAIATHGQMLTNQFTILAELMQSNFAPALDLAASVLSILMREFMQIIPQLVPAQGVLQQLAGNFAQLGVELINILPELAALAVTLAQEFLPPFVTFAQDVLPQAPSMIREFVGVLREVIPVLTPLASALVDMAPALLEFGMATLRLVVPALTDLIRIGTRAMRWVNGLESGLQELVLSATLLAPAIMTAVGMLTTFGSSLGGILTTLTGASSALGAIGTAASALLGPVGLVVAAVAALGAAIATNFGGSRSALGNAFGRMRKHLKAVQPVIRGVRQTVDKLAAAFTPLITWALPILETTFGAVFDGILGIVTGAVGLLIDVMRAGARLLAGDWKEALGIVGKSFKDILVGILQFADKWAPRLREVVLRAAAGAVNAVRNIINKVPGINISKIQQGDIQGLIESTTGKTFKGADRRREKIIREIKTVEIVPSEEFETKQRKVTREEVGNMTERGSRLSGGGL